MPRHRRRSRRLLPVLSLLGAVAAGGVAACSSATPQAFDARMSGFVGRPEAEVVAALGVPSRTYEGDGRRLLQYEFARPSSAPAVYPSLGFGFGSWGGGGFGVGTGLGLGFGGYAAPPDVCVLVFEAREGRITGFNRNGPGCVLPPPPAA